MIDWPNDLAIAFLVLVLIMVKDLVFFLIGYIRFHFYEGRQF